MKTLRAFHRLPEKRRDIVFFSEGASYWNTFKPVIDELLKRGVEFSYLSMSNDDPGLNIDSDLVSLMYLGSGSGFLSLMSMLQANLVVMSTPGLQTLTIKRSPSVSHYAHLVHSPTGISFYRRFSFDHFDTIMCSGAHQIQEIRILESLRNLKAKQLLETGLPYMDILRAQRASLLQHGLRRSEERITVLLAPTWGKNGALSRFGIRIVKAITSGGFDVIIRPHPQQYRSERSLLDSLKKSSAGIPNLQWDDAASGHQSMNISDVMISDLSGVIFDYAFVYEKPVITLDYRLEVNGFEHQDLNGPIWEKEMSRSLGTVISGDELNDLPSTIRNLVSRKDLKIDVQRLREQSLFNFGNVGEVAANQILRMAGASP